MAFAQTKQAWRTAELLATHHAVPEDFKKDLSDVNSVLASAVAAWLKKRGKVRHFQAFGRAVRPAGVVNLDLHAQAAPHGRPADHAT